jgi:hypothetical protein
MVLLSLKFILIRNGAGAPAGGAPLFDRSLLRKNHAASLRAILPSQALLRSNLENR